jgi:hypothetical protein
VKTPVIHWWGGVRMAEELSRQRQSTHSHRQAAASLCLLAPPVALLVCRPQHLLLTHRSPYFRTGSNQHSLRSLPVTSILKPLQFRLVRLLKSTRLLSSSPKSHHAHLASASPARPSWAAAASLDASTTYGEASWSASKDAKWH